jgi:hypothetical protein
VTPPFFLQSAKACDIRWEVDEMIFLIRKLETQPSLKSRAGRSFSHLLTDSEPKERADLNRGALGKFVNSFSSFNQGVFHQDLSHRHHSLSLL